MEFTIQTTSNNISEITFTVKTRKDFRELITFMNRNKFYTFSDKRHIYKTSDFKLFWYEPKKNVLYLDNNDNLHCIIDNRERENRDVKEIIDIWFRR